MPGTLIYDLVRETQRAMVEKIEERLREIRFSCTSEMEFRDRCSIFPTGGYTIYLFDGAPVFYTHFWITNLTLHWTIMEGAPPFDVHKVMADHFFGMQYG